MLFTLTKTILCKKVILKFKMLIACILIKSLLCRTFLVDGDRGGHISQLTVHAHVLFKTGTLETQKLSKIITLCKKEAVAPRCSVERFQSERFQYKELSLKNDEFFFLLCI